MTRRLELIAAWCGPLFVVLFGAGLLVARLVPPPAAADSPVQIANFYDVHAGQIRVGMLLALIGTALYVPFVVGLTRRLRKSNPEAALLADTQLVSGALLLVGVLISVVLIAVGAFRAGRSPEQIQLLNDVAFMMLVWAFAPATIEAAAVGFAVLSDRSGSPVFPRWTGYLDLVVAAIYALGAPTLFVRGGAFGWDGILAFWLVFVAFGVWTLVTAAMMLRALGRERIADDHA